MGPVPDGDREQSQGVSGAHENDNASREQLLQRDLWKASEQGRKDFCPKWGWATGSPEWVSVRGGQQSKW